VDHVSIASHAEVIAATGGSGVGGKLFFLGAHPANVWATMENPKWIDLVKSGRPEDLMNFENLCIANPAIDVFVAGYGPETFRSGTLQGTGIVAASVNNPTVTAQSGDAGQILVSAKNIELAGPTALISSFAQGASKAGKVVLASQGDLTVADGAEVNVSSAGGAGGDVVLSAAHQVYLLRSKVTAESTSGEGGNGNVTITGFPPNVETPPVSAASLAPQFVILNESTLQANAPLGKGGNVTIALNTPVYFQSQDSKIDVSGAVQTGSKSLPPQNISVSTAITEVRTVLEGELPHWEPPGAWELTDLGGYTVVGRQRQPGAAALRRIILQR
jgi:hypothetical protein